MAQGLRKGVHDHVLVSAGRATPLTKRGMVMHVRFGVPLVWKEARQKEERKQDKGKDEKAVKFVQLVEAEVATRLASTRKVVR